MDNIMVQVGIVYLSLVVYKMVMARGINIAMHRRINKQLGRPEFYFSPVTYLACFASTFAYLLIGGVFISLYTEKGHFFLSYTEEQLDEIAYIDE